MPNSNTPNTQVLHSIALAPVAFGLLNCNISIDELIVEAPDSEGQVYVTCKYKITNDTGRDWDSLSVNTAILNASGQIIEGQDRWDEVTVSAGETKELQAISGWFPLKLLGKNHGDSQFIISVTAQGVIQETLRQVQIPDTPLEVVDVNSVNLGGVLQLIAGSVWRSLPDSDKRVNVEFKALMQNLSAHYLQNVWVDFDVKYGDELEDMKGRGEILPGGFNVLSSGTTWIKAKNLKGAVADIKVRAYVPLAQGHAQKSGFSISP